MARKVLLGNLRNIRLNNNYSTSIKKPELDHFKKLADFWWDESGQVKALHSMNKIRIPWITESLKASKVRNASSSLEKYSLLDVGCGAGILSEPLAKAGISVTGLDGIQDLVDLAKSHGRSNNIEVNYVLSTIEDHAKENANKYDAVVISEVIEHITQKHVFIEASIKCLKPNGSLFITTFNKTWLANFLGIFLTETVLNAIPRGTHQYDKFISLEDIKQILIENNCQPHSENGYYYNGFTNTWSWCSKPFFGYALRAVKLEK